MQDCSIVRRKGNLEAGRRAMKSQIVKRSTSAKRSVLIAGHRTSVSLEDAFWKALKEIAGERDMTLSNLVAAINSERQLNNLPSAVRLFVLGLYRDQISEYEKRGRTREKLANAAVPIAPK